MKTRDLLPATLEELADTLTADHPHWRPLRIRPLTCMGGETVWFVRRFRRAFLIVVESPLGTPFPDHRGRVALRDSLRADHDVIIFTDASHTRFLVSGISRTKGGGRVVVERSTDDEGVLLATLFARRASCSPMSTVRKAGRERVVAVVTRAIPARRVAAIQPGPRRSSRESRPASGRGELPGRWTNLISRRIRGIEDPDDVRRLTRTIERTVVIDRVGSIEWLLGAGDALEWLMKLALARMRGFLHDGLAVDTRRPEHLRDFRRAVETYDEALRRESTPCLIRRTIAQRHLFALVPEPYQTGRFRREIEEWVGFPTGRATAIDTNVAVTDPAGAPVDGTVFPGFPDARPPNGDDAYVSPLPAERRNRKGENDDADVVLSAWRLVAADRLVRHDIRPEAWRAAASDLDRRRERLSDDMRDEFRLDLVFPILAGRRRPIVIEPEPER